MVHPFRGDRRERLPLTTQPGKDVTGILDPVRLNQKIKIADKTPLCVRQRIKKASAPFQDDGPDPGLCKVIRDLAQLRPALVIPDGVGGLHRVQIQPEVGGTAGDDPRIALCRREKHRMEMLCIRDFGQRDRIGAFHVTQKVFVDRASQNHTKKAQRGPVGCGRAGVQFPHASIIAFSAG